MERYEAERLLRAALRARKARAWEIAKLYTALAADELADTRAARDAVRAERGRASNARVLESIRATAPANGGPVAAPDVW